MKCQCFAWTYRRHLLWALGKQTLDWERTPQSQVLEHGDQSDQGDHRPGRYFTSTSDEGHRRTLVWLRGEHNGDEDVVAFWTQKGGRSGDNFVWLADFGKTDASLNSFEEFWVKNRTWSYLTRVKVHPREAKLGYNYRRTSKGFFSCTQQVDEKNCEEIL